MPTTKGTKLSTCKGGWRRFFWSAPFNYSLALKLRIASEPGHPEDVILIEPARSGVRTGANVGDLRVLLDRAIVDGVSGHLKSRSGILRRFNT